MAVAFQSQHVLGGTFCLDAQVPDSIYNVITSDEGASVFPQYEAKKDMWICMTKQQEMLDQLRTVCGQQGQMLRGKGFNRLQQAELKKCFERALAQVHVYSRLGGTNEYDNMVKMQ